MVVKAITTIFCDPIVREGERQIAYHGTRRTQMIPAGISPSDFVQIEQLICCYFANIDQKEFVESEYREILTDDCIMARPNGALVGSTAICLSHRESFSRFHKTQHTVTNLVFQSEGQLWRVRGNIQAMHIWKPEFIELTSLETFFLAHSVLAAVIEKADERWKIKEVKIDVVFRQGSNSALMRATK